MDRSPAPLDSSALPERSDLNRQLMHQDLLRLSAALARHLHRRLPLALRGVTSPDSVRAQVEGSLLALLEAPDAELVPAIDALALELGAWRYFRTAQADELAAALEPLAERVL